MITLDTSAVLSLLDRGDDSHQSVLRSLREAGRPFYIPIPLLSELSYMVEARFGNKTLLTLLNDICDQRYTLDWDDGDAERIRELVTRYDDLPLGLADASVVACAERNGGKILTLDRDFFVIAKEGNVTVHPVITRSS